MVKGAGSSKKLGNGARSKMNYQGTRGKIKKEQGAKRDEKGAGKLAKRSERKMEGSRENRVKCRRKQGAKTPLTEPHYSQLHHSNAFLYSNPIRGSDASF